MHFKRKRQQKRGNEVKSAILGRRQRERIRNMYKSEIAPLLSGDVDGAYRAIVAEARSTEQPRSTWGRDSILPYVVLSLFCGALLVLGYHNATAGAATSHLIVSGPDQRHASDSQFREMNGSLPWQHSHERPLRCGGDFYTQQCAPVLARNPLPAYRYGLLSAWRRLRVQPPHAEANGSWRSTVRRIAWRRGCERCSLPTTGWRERYTRAASTRRRSSR